MSNWLHPPEFLTLEERGRESQKLRPHWFPLARNGGVRDGGEKHLDNFRVCPRVTPTAAHQGSNLAVAD